MITVWDLIYQILADIIWSMKEITIFYGISVWDLCIIFLVLDIIREIIATIFRHNTADDGDVTPAERDYGMRIKDRDDS